MPEGIRADKGRSAGYAGIRKASVDLLKAQGERRKEVNDESS